MEVFSKTITKLQIILVWKEPPARIELATSSLPMRCYTAKPRWRSATEPPFDYNHFANQNIDYWFEKESVKMLSLSIFYPQRLKGYFTTSY